MTRKPIYFLGLLVYVISLFLPVWNCVGHGAFLGWHVLLTGIMGVYGLDPRWFCNIVIVLAFFMEDKILFGISVVLCLVASTSIFGPFYCTGFDGGAVGESISFGGLMWIVSLWIVTFSHFFPKKLP